MDNKIPPASEPPAFRPPVPGDSGDTGFNAQDKNGPGADLKKDPFAPDASQFNLDGSSDSTLRWTPQPEATQTNPWPQRALLAVTLLCLTAAVWLGIFAAYQHQEHAEQQINEAAIKTATLVHQLESEFLSPAQQLVQQMQAQIRHESDDLENLKALVQSKRFQLKPASFGIAYLPHAYDETIRLKAPFYRRDAANQYTRENIESVYDYSRPPKTGENYDSRWFTEGIRNDGGWQEPYFGRIMQGWLAQYSLPIYRANPDTGEQEKVGLVFADFVLDEVRDMVRRITLDSLAYGYLVSPQGIVVSHPDRHLLGQSIAAVYDQQLKLQSTSDTPQTSGVQPNASQPDSARHNKRIFEQVDAGDNFVEEFYDEATGQTSVVVHRQVPQSGWSFGIVMPKESVYSLASSSKHIIVLALAALALAVIGAITLFRFNDLHDDRLPWIISSLFSVFAVVLAIFALNLFWDQSDNPSPKLFSLSETIAARGAPAETTDLIPTGILVNSIEFPEPETAAVGGIIWQKFALTDEQRRQNLAPKDTPAGIIWPDAKLGSEEMVLLRDYEADNMQVKAWRFRIEVPLDRNITKFPFDMSEIQLRMRSMPDTKAVLVPDFEAYNLLIPELKPGVDQAIDLIYWDILASFFSVDSSRDMKYSGTQITDLNKDSEIVFRVQMARQSHVILVSYFLPIFIGSIMMFVVLMIPSDKSLSAVFSILGYGGTIFFVISIFHVNLRNSEGIDSFTYLESYYIMQHILVMVISLNGFFLMRGASPRWIHYRNNLLPKVLYWPSLSLFFACSTAAYFL